MPWRAEDEVLLQRLEDEALVFRLFAFYTRRPELRHGTLHPRAGGLVSEVRKLPGGAAAVAAALDDDAHIGALAKLIDALPLSEGAPELLHHLALFHATAAAALEHSMPEAAATAWVRSLAAWLALSEERAYLGELEEAILGEAKKRRSGDAAPPPAPQALIAEMATRAAETARDLGIAGRAALLALARTDEAAELAAASPAAAKQARALAQRKRNAAIESALAAIGEAIDEATVRGDVTETGLGLLLLALPVWGWTSEDEAVEHFVIDRAEKIGWELYRARKWDGLRSLLAPFRPIFDSLGRRIARDPSQIAYASGCAQMFVFLSEVELTLPGKLRLAEHALELCPSHRNGRLVLAHFLCDDATETMKKNTIVTRALDLDRVAALLARAEKLYPQSSSLPDAKAMFERLKKNQVTA